MFIVCGFWPFFCCRSWRTDLCKGSCALVCVSVEHDDSPHTGAVRGVVLESHYLLEPWGTARTRLTHISRVDLRCGQLLSAPILGALVPIANEKYALSAVCIAGGGLQNGTIRLLATCVLTKPRWSAPLFTCWIRRVPRSRLEHQKSVLILDRTSQSNWAWLQVTPQGGIIHANWDLVSFQAAEHYCNVIVSSRSHTEEYTYLRKIIYQITHQPNLRADESLFHSLFVFPPID